MKNIAVQETKHANQEFKHAIFDLDGTLLDSMWIWENIDVEFLDQYGKTPEPGLRESLKTLSVRQSAELFKETFNLSLSLNEIIDAIGALAREKYKYEAQLKPYVREFLGKLKSEGIKMCLLTASVRENVEAALSRLNISDMFEFIITGEDMIKGKDHPDTFLACAQRLNMPPEKMIVFEDALHAVKTAKNAGFRVVGVYDDSAAEDRTAIKQICDCYIESFKEIMDMSVFGENT